ncbi:hypothetical protein GK047_22475 [Paenibacillus sp. SYP-B3998]|uniref:Uncharacterized protein n=1 Tax=Paenibacillus sp. SYP-B3998 TaxID=2678564 RepID=A0A6G4A300_9BACL|nr:hypothetical protein [Paenibacillus sp. SYP-B3998]NEW08765.1 hypothetical protein [Paenibacillus sp. SYP-B3998]
MKLNLRKIMFIVVCAELLFIYWNSISAIPFRRQQTTNPISTPRSNPSLTQIKPLTLRGVTVTETYHEVQKAS